MKSNTLKDFNRSHKRAMDLHKYVFILIAVFALCSIPLAFAIPLYTQDTITVTVTDKSERTQVDSEGRIQSSKYLVFTETETLENTDVFVLGKFHSSDIQGRLREDSTYTLRVYGWRVPFLSMYRNIIDVSE